MSMKTPRFLHILSVFLLFCFLWTVFIRITELRMAEISLKEKEVDLKTKELMLMDRLATCPNGKVAKTRSGYECFGRVVKLEN
jgi:hypothetical protein